MHPSVDFDAVARALAAGASAVYPAEAHGCLCGALCVRHDYALADWLDEILPDAAAVEDAGPLAELHADSATVLARPDMEFEPLLPDDASTLAARVGQRGRSRSGRIVYVRVEMQLLDKQTELLNQALSHGEYKNQQRESAIRLLLAGSPR